MEIVPYLGQDFSQLRNLYNNRNLFEDPKFPASQESISRRRRVQVQWKRPHQIISNPQLIINGIEPNDIAQGQIGDCWFIAAACCLTTVPQYVDHVIPKNQSFDPNNYCGMFHFRFWRDDKWFDVVIDDRLPVGYDGKLYFCSNKKYPNELWCCLLEKAYAKFNKCYEFLDGGLTQEGLVDLTGGVSETFIIPEIVKIGKQNELWEVMKQAYKLGSLSGCGIIVNEGERQEGRKANGLIVGHAYSVTKIVEIGPKNRYFGALSANSTAFYSDKICLLKLRNPWANHEEWLGPFSDRSPEWNRISEDVKLDLGLVRENDGEFWIPYADFLRNFSTLDYCHLKMEALVGDSFDWRNINNQKIKWKSQSFHGRWERGISAGGSGNEDQRQFWTNPQYLVKIDQLEGGEKVNIIVSLYIKDMLQIREKNLGQYSGIEKQFRIYAIKSEVNIEEQIRRRMRFNSSQLMRIGSSKAYSFDREVTARFSLKPGYYVIIPSTFIRDQTASFLLRIYSEFKINDSDVTDLDNLNPNIEDPKPDDNNFNHIEDKIFDGLKDDLFDKLFNNNGSRVSSNDWPLNWETQVDTRYQQNDDWESLEREYNSTMGLSRQMQQITMGNSKIRKEDNACIFM